MVRGGVGGTRASLEGVAAAAARVTRAVGALASAAECVHRARGGPWPAEVLGDVNDGAGGLPACAERAARLAVGLRAALRAYEDADHDARSRLAAVAIATGGTLGDLGPAWWGLVGLGAAGSAGVALAQVSLLRALRGSPGLLGLLLRDAPDLSGLPGAAGWLGGAATGAGGLLPDGLGLPYGDTMELVVLGLAAFALGAQPGVWVPTARPVADLTRLLSVTVAGWAALRGRPPLEVLVAPLVGARGKGGAGGAGGTGGAGGSRGEPAPEGIGDVMHRVAELGDAPGPVVGVQRLDHPDGSTGWVVSVPGMRSGAVVPGVDPMDNATNAALMAGLPDAMTDGVEEAMLRAGVGPQDPVLLAGYSQGGMVATRLATSLQGTFTIEAVLTAGSPVGSMPVPAGVTALHLEHAQDWVPALDGAPNPDAVNRTTVVRTLPGGGAAVAGTQLGLTPAGLGQAHSAWEYAGTAAEVERLADPSVDGFRAALDRVLGEGSRATSQSFLVARVPERG
ncbi:hypothetical protein [Actinotalea fermentans]|uniref:hypothetical protein n=1 Tax=Actinotalea fermentans TaxID=43671 RepID=UPI0011BF7C77|nr:hypothetical protein [Actinotalea fermentans]